MKDKELIKIWQTSTAAQEKINQQSPKLLSNMDKELARFENRINARDNREIIVALMFALFLGGAVFRIEAMTEKIGSLLLMGYCLWIIFYLLKVKNKKPNFSITASMKEQLIAYRTYVLHQQKAVDSVLYWYLLPMLPGVFLFWMGFESYLALAISAIVLVLVFVWIYRLNKRAAVENYNPLLAELGQAIKQLEEIK